MKKPKELTKLNIKLQIKHAPPNHQAKEAIIAICQSIKIKGKISLLEQHFSHTL